MDEEDIRQKRDAEIRKNARKLFDEKIIMEQQQAAKEQIEEAFNE